MVCELVRTWVGTPVVALEVFCKPLHSRNHALIQDGGRRFIMMRWLAPIACCNMLVVACMFTHVCLRGVADPRQIKANGCQRPPMSS